MSKKEAETFKIPKMSATTGEKLVALQVLEESLVYQMTPEVAFTPSEILREKKKYVQVREYANTEREGLGDLVTYGDVSVVYRIGSVLPPRESRNVEYKQGGGNYYHDIFPLHVRKYGSAFLNSGGGTLCIGVRDDGVVVGVRLGQEAKQRVRETVKYELEHFTPPVYQDMYELDFVPCTRYDCFVIELHVRPGGASEIYSDRDNQMYMKRDGSVQGPLWPRDIREIVTQKYLSELEKSKLPSADPNTFPLLALSMSEFQK